MPLVFPVVLLLILGAVTLTSRSTNSFLAASKQSDAQAARDAAESGMNLVLSALDPYRKTAANPYMSYLLGTSWDREAGAGGLSRLDPAAVQTRLRQCDSDISEQGLKNQDPPTSSELSAIIGDPSIPNGAVLPPISSLDPNRSLKYEVLKFEGPEGVDGSKQCMPDFLNLSGGSASITVRGTVWRNEREVASYVLKRNVDVQGLLVPIGTDGLPNPGAPTSLRIERQGIGTGTIEQLAFSDFKNGVPGLTIPVFAICPICDPSLIKISSVQKKHTTTPIENRDLPPFPQSPKDGEFTLKSYPDPDNNPSTPAMYNLSWGDCMPDPVRKDEANCLIQADIGENVEIIVDTTDGGKQKIVNLFITAINVGSNNNPVRIKHKDFNPDSSSARPTWKNLRIFGLPPKNPKEQCTNPTQSFYIEANQASPSLNGTFVWLPDAKLRYGKEVSIDGLLHGEDAPNKLLSSWWLCDLELKLTGNMTFLSPLNGNPESLVSIFPNPYPTLFRIRSVY
jgi:hypothetical protein